MMLLTLAAAVSDACSPPAGTAHLSQSAAKYIVIGELHGTRQAPAAVAEIACKLAERGKPILVALELRSIADPVLQRAWAGPRKDFNRTLLSDMPDWRERKDGVVSQAMLALLERLHALKLAGRRIDVVAFTGPRDPAQAARFASLPGQGPNEAAQADNIRIAAEAKDYAKVLVLVGNVHARKLRWERARTPFDPMVVQLASPKQVLALDLAHSGGTAWNCVMKGAPPASGPITSDALDCSAHPARATPFSQGGAPRVVLNKDLRTPPGPDPAYDGILDVGPIVASPPVLSEQPAGSPQ